MKATQKCDECGSSYYVGTSNMAALCPECSHLLYGYAPCKHDFESGRCRACGWDGARSRYIRSLLKKRD